MPHVLLVDFKYNGEKATIVEFGCGLNSSYTGYDAIHNTTQENLMYALIYEKLASRYDKIIFVAQYAFILQGILELSQLKSEQFHITDSSSYRGAGRCKFNKTETILSQIETILAQKKPEEKYCVVVCAKESLKAFTLANIIRKNISTKNVDVINSNDSVASLAKNKFMYAYFGGKDHIPTEIIDLDNISSAKLIALSQFNKIVLKPTDGSGGNGVKIATEENLLYELNLIKFLNDFKQPSYQIYEHLPPLEEQNKRFGQRINFDGKDNDGWFGTNTSHFAILQQYQTGKIVEEYNPTGRMVFIVNDDLTEIDFVDGYWKLPPQKFNSDDNTNSQKYVSDAHPKNKTAFSLAINEQDKKAIQAALIKPVLVILKQAMKKSLEQHFKDIKSNTDQDIRNYASVLENSFKKLIINNSSQNNKGISEKQELTVVTKFESPLSQSEKITANSMWNKGSTKNESCDDPENNSMEKSLSTL